MNVNFKFFEKPIIFSTEMVLAILEDRKTQTRRIINPQPEDVEYYLYGKKSNRHEGLPIFRDETGKGWAMCGKFKCPYLPQELCAVENGIIKNARTDDLEPKVARLWVREGFRYRGNDESIFQYKAGGAIIETPEDLHSDDPVFERLISWSSQHKGFKPSIHMPRFACRILLDVVSVRVERLQAISEDDSKAEGVTPPAGNMAYGRHKVAFESLWESIHGHGANSWRMNPWVWVVEFKKGEVKCS